MRELWTLTIDGKPVNPQIALSYNVAKAWAMATLRRKPEGVVGIKLVWRG